MTKSKLLSLLTLAAAVGFALATLGSHGCTSNCAANCPATTVYIGNLDNHELNGVLVDLAVNGPACPDADSVICVGDMSTTGCTHTTITAPRAGWCDVLFAFSDRPNEILRLEFSDTINANGSCCQGYPVVGPSVYTIPDKPTGPIYSGTAGTPSYDTDAVVVLTDAGAEAGTDAGADAGTP